MNIMRFARWPSPGSNPSLRSLLSLPPLALLLAVQAQAQQTVSGTQCMGTRAQLDGGYALGCTANDIRIASATILPDASGNPVACPYPGAEVTFRAQFTVESTATERYDIGLWFAQDGDPNNDGALTGTCSVSTLPTGPAGSFINIDGTTQPGDTCGDIKKPAYNPLYPIVEMTATCVDYDQPGDPGYGKLDLPYCTSWRQSGSNELCTSALQAYPGAPSKCKCDRTFDVPIDVPPARLLVTKTPYPTSVAEPGGDVKFSLSISNPGVDPNNSVTLDALTDDIINDSGTVMQALGGLFTGGKGAAIRSTTCTKDTSIAGNGGDYDCEFTVRITGNAGARIKDRVTAGGTDAHGNAISGTATATVTITDTRPDITVVKSASTTDVNEPGGNVTFTVTVTNTSPAGSLDPIRITSLVDDVYGNLNGVGTCNTAGNAYPTALISGASYTCSFTKFVAGDGKTKTSVTDVISATVVDDDGGAPYTKDSNPITVSIKPVGSSISVQKEVSYNGGAWLKSLTIDEAPSPGVTVNYRVVITNNSTVDLVTINSLKDKVKLNGGSFGASYDLVSDCVLPFDLASNGGSKTCSFSLKLYGNAGDSHVNEVTASGFDDDEDPVTDSSSAAVEFMDVAPTAALTKTATKAATVFRVTITNTSTAEPLFVNGLIDDKFGDITKLKPDSGVETTTCRTGVEIGIGRTYECYFTAFVDNTGEAHVNTVTATVSDDEAHDVTPNPSDTAEVSLK